jgi:ribokinase
MASKLISIIGGLDYDLIMIANRIPVGGESLKANEYREALGGKGANSAIATYRACHEAPMTDKSYKGVAINVNMIGAVGDDEYGKRFKEKLSDNGIDCTGVETVANTQTSICFVMVESSTQENRCLFTPGATATWKKEHFLTGEDLGHGVRPDLCVAQMEIHRDVVEQMIETAGEADIDFCLNAAPANRIARHLYRYLTHLLVSESEAAVMSGRSLHEVNKDTWSTICQEFLDLGVHNAIITLGANGAYFANAKDCGHCLGYKVEAVDTTGAG